MGVKNNENERQWEWKAIGMKDNGTKSRLEPIGLPRQKSLSEIGGFKVILHFYALPVDNIVQISIYNKATMRYA